MKIKNKYTKAYIKRLLSPEGISERPDENIEALLEAYSLFKLEISLSLYSTDKDGKATGVITFPTQKHDTFTDAIAYQVASLVNSTLPEELRPLHQYYLENNDFDDESEDFSNKEKLQVLQLMIDMTKTKYTNKAKKWDALNKELDIEVKYLEVIKSEYFSNLWRVSYLLKSTRFNELMASVGLEPENEGVLLANLNEEDLQGLRDSYIMLETIVRERLAFCDMLRILAGFYQEPRLATEGVELYEWKSASITIATDEVEKMDRQIKFNMLKKAGVKPGYAQAWLDSNSDSIEPLVVDQNKLAEGIDRYLPLIMIKDLAKINRMTTGNLDKLIEDFQHSPVEDIAENFRELLAEIKDNLSIEGEAVDD